MDVIANAINTIKVSENIGKDYCIVPSTKLLKSILGVLKRDEYIKGYEEFMEGNVPKIKVMLAKKINDIGVITPRLAVKINNYQKYEVRYIPSKDFGILVVSTPKGVMSNREAKEKHIGGRLLAYVY